MQQGRPDRAAELYREALALFQQAGDLEGEMQTCDLLATAERERGQLDAAEAWYGRARELAQQLGDRHQLAVVAQDVGILYQARAEGTQDPAQREGWLRRAASSVGESLAVWLEMNNRVNTAAAYSQLGVLYRMLGEWKQAEEHSMQALRIHEELNHPDVYRDYWNLADIARARGDAPAAAGWQAKYEAKVAKLARLARGEGTPAAAQVLQGLVEALK